MTDSSQLVQPQTQSMMSEPSVSMWTQEGSVSVSSVARCSCDVSSKRFGGESLHWEHDLILVVVSLGLVVDTSE